MDLLIGIVAVASLVVGLFSIYVTIDGRITKVKDDADQNFHSVKDFSKDGLGRLERTIAAVCENLREVEETQFETRCKKDEGGQYDVNAHACLKKDKPAERFKKPCPEDLSRPIQP